MVMLQKQSTQVDPIVEVFYIDAQNAVYRGAKT